jgi:7-cyano-7-deazaguanine synthase in queuosine biosynthesis
MRLRTVPLFLPIGNPPWFANIKRNNTSLPTVEIMANEKRTPISLTRHPARIGGQANRLSGQFDSDSAVRIGTPRWIEFDRKPVWTAPIHVGERTHEVWFRATDDNLSREIDPFFTIGLMAAMRTNLPICSTQPVSAQLLAALPKLQQQFHAWYPEYQPQVLKIPPRSANPTSASNRCVATFFSGGVDSFYTLHSHRNAIRRLVFVHGFDVPLENIALRREVSDALKQIADRVEIPLIEVETNVRSFLDHYGNWALHTHGAALASVAQLLAPQIHCIHIPASNAYPDYSAWGSHPWLDPLWSTEEVEILYDGFETPRVEKAGTISQWDVAMDYLRVCYLNEKGSYNCGRCEKCVRTMVALRIFGAEGRCRTLPSSLNLWRVATAPVYDAWTRRFVLENLDALHQQGEDAPLERALLASLEGRYRRGLWRYGWAVWKRLPPVLRGVRANHLSDRKVLPA